MKARGTSKKRWGRLYRANHCIFSVIVAFFLAACSNPSAKSQELYETAQFEEQQRSFDHAKKLYHRIVDDYPQAPTAAKAKERLKALEAPPAR